LSLSRRLRAAVVVAALWGVAWTIGGAVLGLYRVRHGGIAFDWVQGGRDVLRFVIPFAAAWGGIGAANGLAFAGVLAALGRRSAPRGVTAGPAARWGALGGLALPTIFIAFIALDSAAELRPAGVVALLGGSAALGAVCALGTLALAGGASRPGAQAT